MADAVQLDRQAAFGIGEVDAGEEPLAVPNLVLADGLRQTRLSQKLDEPGLQLTLRRRRALRPTHEHPPECSRARSPSTREGIEPPPQPLERQPLPQSRLQGPFEHDLVHDRAEVDQGAGQRGRRDPVDEPDVHVEQIRHPVNAVPSVTACRRDRQLDCAGSNAVEPPYRRRGPVGGDCAGASTQARAVQLLDPHGLEHTRSVHPRLDALVAATHRAFGHAGFLRLSPGEELVLVGR